MIASIRFGSKLASGWKDLFMKVTILIPLKTNDGLPVADERLHRILEDMAATYNGRSQEGLIVGWSCDNGKYRCDTSLKVSFVCPNSRLLEAQRDVVRIGRVLQQYSMYFEVRDFDGVEFLPCHENNGK